MTDAELIYACRQVACLTDSIERHARTLAERGDFIKGNAKTVQRWHDNRVIERAEVLDLIWAECPLPNITPRAS